MVKAQRFVYSTKFSGEPKESDFTLETEELAPIKDGGKHFGGHVVQFSEQAKPDLIIKKKTSTHD